MARIARVVAPGHARHVTQRGNRRQQTFFKDEDYELYLNLMAEWLGKHEVAIWAYCLMTNHVHLVAGAENFRWVAASNRGSASKIHEAYKFPRRMARAFMAGSLFVLCYG